MTTAAQVGGLDKATIEQWIEDAQAHDDALKAKVSDIADAMRKSDARITDVRVEMLNHFNLDETDWTILIYSDRHHREAQVEISVTDELIMSEGLDVAGLIVNQALENFERLEANP